MTIKRENTKNIGYLIGIALFVIVISVIKSYSILNYSMYKIDEEHVVQYAVGFLDFDFNPRWFGYHTLPMYILSVFYFITYCIYSMIGLVATKAEFVSLLFSDNSVFFIIGRLVFSVAYSIGCLVLSKIIYDRYRSVSAAIMFFLACNIFPEALRAANEIRVDTFVFMFMAFAMYYGCYVEKTTKSYILSIAMCAAAFTSKLPAVALFPILALTVLFYVFKGDYQKKHLYYLIPTYSLLTFAFMPFAFLDYKSYLPVIGNIVNRSSGNHYHIGKIHNFTAAARLETIYSLLVSQVGILCILLCILGVYFFVRRHEDLFALLFCLAYTSIFVTSLTVDSYWLIPTYPMFVFFAYIALCESSGLVREYLKEKPYNLARASALMLLLYLVVISSTHLRNNVHAALNASEDVRISSGKWIQDNIPNNSIVWLDGHIEYYNPRIVTCDKEKDLLVNGYWGVSNKNDIINAGYENFIKMNCLKHTPAVFNLIGPGNLSSKFMERGKRFNIGDIVIINSWTYKRYFQDNVMKGLESVAQDARQYYAAIRKQQHLKTFNSNGSVVEIYRIISSFDHN